MPLNSRNASGPTDPHLPPTVPRLTLARIFSFIRFVWAHPGNHGHRLRSMARLLAWQLWQRVVRQPRCLTLPRDLRMKCYPHSAPAALVLYCGLPEWEHMHFVLDYLRPGDTFIDVGANVGTYSLLAASTRDVDVFAFEPSTIAFRRLQENVVLNGLEHRVRTAPVAVGGQPGLVTLSTGRDAMNRVLASHENDPGEAVPMVTIDSFLQHQDIHPVRLMKVDVEGFEENVLKGALGVLVAAGPVLIVEANDVDALCSLLEPLGYRPCFYDVVLRRLRYVDWSSCVGGNLLAVRYFDFAQGRLDRLKPSYDHS